MESFIPQRRKFLLGAASGLIAAGLPWQARAAAPERIVATTGMIADAARVLTGQPVRALIGPGIDPHSHRPTRADIAALVRADLALYHGLHLEAAFATLFEELPVATPLVAVAESFHREGVWLEKGVPDPHIWFDPSLWSRVVQGMVAPLRPFAPDVDARAAAHLAEIADMRRYAEEVLSTIPQPARVLVTAHDAFSYFGRAFGLEVAGVQGISTESEAGVNHIAQLVDLLVERKIPAVFVESSVSDRALRALIEGAAMRGHQLRIGGELFSDAMGVEGSYEGTWLGMFDHNVTMIARALGGTAPEAGRNGRLGAVS